MGITVEEAWRWAAGPPGRDGSPPTSLPPSPSDSTTRAALATDGLLSRCIKIRRNHSIISQPTPGPRSATGPDLLATVWLEAARTDRAEPCRVQGRAGPGGPDERHGCASLQTDSGNETRPAIRLLLRPWWRRPFPGAVPPRAARCPASRVAARSPSKMHALSATSDPPHDVGLGAGVRQGDETVSRPSFELLSSAARVIALRVE